MIRPVDLAHASRLINHGPTVLVTSSHKGRRNVMAAAWSMPVEFAPPRIAVVVDKSTYTRELITNSDSFGISIPCRANADLVYTVGSVTGRPDEENGTDKFSRYGIESFAGPTLGLPCVAGCVAWLECRVLAEPAAQERYDTFFGEVVSAQADSRVFADGHWSFGADNIGLHTLHHLGGGLFALPAQTIQAEMLPSAD
jgi:flavin reductase (DIM6/NTAB) family NADH-FMN oxidoreductase RutF